MNDSEDSQQPRPDSEPDPATVEPLSSMDEAGGADRDRKLGGDRNQHLIPAVDVPTVPKASFKAKRQTQSYLRTLFESRGIGPRKRYGQNFLVDLNIHDLIVASAELGADDIVLEVGSGTGALTRAMAEQAGAVVAVEIDPAMAELAAEAVSECDNVTLLRQDALAKKSQMAPEVLDRLRELKQVDPERRRIKLVANLPYNVATPLISNLMVLPEVELSPRLMVVTIQWELGVKMLAPPETSDYNALSVLVQALGEPELIRQLPPSVFWPRPQVDSAILRIRLDPSRRQVIDDLPWFHRLVRMLFIQRRKNLRRVLHSYYRDRFERSEIDAFLNGEGLTGLIRAEALAPARHITLARAIRQRFGLPTAAKDLEAELEP